MAMGEYQGDGKLMWLYVNHIPRKHSLVSQVRIVTSSQTDLVVAFIGLLISMGLEQARE